MVAMRSQLTFYKESIRRQRQPRPRFHPAFRLLWVLLSGRRLIKVAAAAAVIEKAKEFVEEAGSQWKGSDSTM